MRIRLCLYGAVIAALGIGTSAFADVTLNATGGDGKISLSWTATENLRNVQVMRDTDADPVGRQRVATVVNTVRSFTDTTAVNGAQYWYWIKYTDATGTVRNSNAGSAKAAATDSGSQPIVAVTSVTVSPASVSVAVGATASLSGSVLPATATNKALSWRSSNTGVATVGATGVVTGVSAGNATVTATSADGNRSANSAITVTAANSGNTGNTGNCTAAALPLVIDGVGEFCRVTTGDLSEFNSWNMQLVEVNGVAFTNAYANTWSKNFPAKVDGKYTIRYVGKYPWSHLEVKGSGGSDDNGSTPQPNNSTISAASTGFDKNSAKQADVGVTMTLNGNTLSAIRNGGTALVSGTDYSVSGNTVTLLKAYLAKQTVGTLSLTFDFSAGNDPVLKLAITDTTSNTTPGNSTISTASTGFDKNAAKQADVGVTMTLNGNTLSAIRNGGTALVSGTDYSVSGNTVTLLKAYLAKQTVGTLSLTFDFSAGNDPVLKLAITDTTSNGGSAPAAPSGLGATVVDNGAVNLVWTDKSTNETGFRVERQLSGDVSWTKLTDTAANTLNYRDASVEMGKAYVYRVSAFNATATSTGITTLATLLTLKKYGEQQYAAQACNVCHGSDGKGGTSPLKKAYTSADLSALTASIAATMPDDSGKCKGNCALATATYLVDAMSQGNSGTPTCAGTAPPSARSLRLMTRQEYQNTVNDLLGLKTSLINTMPQENRVDGFDNNIETNLVTSIRLESFLAQSQSLATQAVKTSFSKLVPCNTQDTACAKQFIQTFGKKAYRRPLSTAEQNDYQTVFSQNAFNAAVELSVARMLASPHFLYRSELGTKQSDGTYRLTQYEIASSLSYLFLGSLPDDALFLAADKGELATTAQQVAQATRLMNLPRSRQQVGNFVGQWLLSSSPYTLPDKDMGVYPKYAQAKASMSDELINFFNHVAFDSTQKFSELFSADYAVVNKTLADYYGLSGTAGTSFAPVKASDGTRMGIMTLGAVLSRYANSNESHPFKRGGFLYKRLLCDDLPFPANAGIVKAPKQDPNATTRERFDFHSKSGDVCWSCHKFIDAPGFAFENYDGAGQYRATENGRPIDASGNVLGLETFTEGEQDSINNLGDLSRLVSNSPNASQCVARQYYRFTTGKREGTEDECALNSFIDGYKASGYNLKTMLLGIVSSPGFTVRRSN